MKQVNGHTAKEVSEMLLKQTGDALLSNDFALFAQCFHLPHTIETGDNKRVLKTFAEMRAVFDSVVGDYARKRVTDLVRITEVAEFRSDTRIEAAHMTHMMSGDQRVTDPFPCFSVLEFIDDCWRSTASQYAVDTHTTVGRALAENVAHTATASVLTEQGNHND